MIKIWFCSWTCTTGLHVCHGLQRDVVQCEAAVVRAPLEDQRRVRGQGRDVHLNPSVLRFPINGMVLVYNGSSECDAIV